MKTNVLAALVVALALVCGCAFQDGDEWAADDQSPPLPDRGPAPVILVAGQSNCNPGLLVNLPIEDQWTPPNVSVFKFGAWGDIILEGETKFGAELSMLQILADYWPDEELRLVKYWEGGTSMRAWLTYYYQPLITTVRDMARVRPDILIWIQGEKDSIDPILAADYQENMMIFFDQLRRDLNPDLQIIVIEVWTVYDYITSIRMSQEDVAMRDPAVEILDSADLPRRDGLHLTASSTIILGQRIAEKVEQLTISPGR